MSKIVLPPIASGYNLSKINVNFYKIQEALDKGILWRQPPNGEPNQMETDLDMNGHRIYNAIIGEFADYYTAEQSDSRFVHRAGDLMIGELDMGQHSLTGLPPSSRPGDAVPKSELSFEREARITGDQSLQEQIIDTTGPVPASQFSVISWHGRVVENSVSIPPDVNAWSIGPEIAVAPGQEVTVGVGSTWTIIEGTLV